MTDKASSRKVSALKLSTPPEITVIDPPYNKAGPSTDTSPEISMSPAEISRTAKIYGYHSKTSTFFKCSPLKILISVHSHGVHFVK